jgi:hypothetical protein
MVLYVVTGRGSAVGTATGDGLDGSGIESRWRRDLPHLSRPVLGLTQPPAQWVPGLSRGQSGRGVASITTKRLKKEWSYTSTPPVGLRGLF